MSEKTTNQAGPEESSGLTDMLNDAGARTLTCIARRRQHERLRRLAAPFVSSVQKKIEAACSEGKLYTSLPWIELAEGIDCDGERARGLVLIFEEAGYEVTVDEERFYLAWHIRGKGFPGAK